MRKIILAAVTLSGVLGWQYQGGTTIDLPSVVRVASEQTGVETGYRLASEQTGVETSYSTASEQTGVDVGYRVASEATGVDGGHIV